MNIWLYISYSVNSNAQMTPVKTFGEPFAHKFCAVNIFWNISRRQAISPVAKFHNVLGTQCFHDSAVILIYIKCFSANQNWLYITCKYNILIYCITVYMYNRVFCTVLNCLLIMFVLWCGMILIFLTNIYVYVYYSCTVVILIYLFKYDEVCNDF